MTRSHAAFNRFPQEEEQQGQKQYSYYGIKHLHSGVGSLAEYHQSEDYSHRKAYNLPWKDQ